MAKRRRKLKHIGDELVNADLWDFDPVVAYYQQSWVNDLIERWWQKRIIDKCGTRGCSSNRFTCAVTRDRNKVVTVCPDCFDPTLYVLCRPWLLR